MCKFPEVLSDTCKVFFIYVTIKHQVQSWVLSWFLGAVAPPGCEDSACPLSPLSLKEPVTKAGWHLVHPHR